MMQKSNQDAGMARAHLTRRSVFPMAARGFIHDKLEIKFLILYITARLVEPVPFDLSLIHI